MLIQNAGSVAISPRFTSDGAPVAVAAPETRAAPVEQKTKAPTQTQVQNAVDSLNKAMGQISSDVQFSIDKSTKQTVIRVVESKTGEVIRQFPSEEVLAISRAIDQMQQQGLLLKQKA